MAKPSSVIYVQKYRQSVGLISGTNELVRLIELLQKIDTSSPATRQNETSISDNNGGRIIL